MKRMTLMLGLLLATPAFSAAPESRIVAVVNKDVITQKDVNDRLKLAFLSSGMPDTKQNREVMRQQILHAMIDETLQLRAAKDAGIEVDDEDIAAAIRGMEENTGATKGSALKTLRTRNIPEQTLTNQARAHLGWDQFIQAKYVPILQMSDSEIEQEFRRVKDAEQMTQYRLSEIWIPIDSQISEADARKDIEKLRQNIQKGAPFPAIAQQFSLSPTASLGGDLGWQSEEQISPEVRSEVTKLRVGQVSQPVRVSGGYAILALTGRQLPGESLGTRVSLLQVDIPYPLLATDYEIEETVNSLKQMANSSRNCSALAARVAKVEGGHSEQSAMLSYTQLNKDILPLVQSLGKGQSSEALATPDGAILFMICDKQDIKPQEWTKDAVSQALIRKKLALLSRRELRDIRRQAFIEVRQ